MPPGAGGLGQSNTNHRTKLETHMKTLKLILGCLISAAFSLGLAAAPPHRRLRVNGLTDGTHGSGILGSLYADAALTTRYLLVKTGSDSSHFAACGAGDKPLGPCLDEPSAAEELASVALLGAVKGTVKMVGSEAIAKDADVYTAASGKVQDEPASAGTYYLVGRAATACTGDGDTFEVIPCLPQLTKVIANGSTLGQTQAAMVNGAVVIVLGA